MKLGTETNSNMLNLMMMMVICPALDKKYIFFRSFGPKNKNCLFKVKISTYTTGHNILELCNVLVQVRFATSKTKLGI